jgi:predicted phage terminase large subunit-like protein
VDDYDIPADTDIQAQPGFQMSFLTTPADIAFGGGAAGSGKSFALLMDPLRHIHTPGFDAIFFRRVSTQIRGGGGIWDEALRLYTRAGARVRAHASEFLFPTGGRPARIAFSHLQYESDAQSHQSKQYAAIFLDEASQFTSSQFWALLSRNRSTCGVRPFVKATTNPDPDSWVREFLAWWINPETGFPIPERAGVLRWFLRVNDKIEWADSPEDLLDMFPDALPDAPLSVTFIPGSLDENKILNTIDPGYRSKLLALPMVERQKLLEGNWNARARAGNVFKREWLPVVDVRPAEILKTVRAWDKAATEKRKGNDPDWTAGVRMSQTRSGLIIIEDAVRRRETPGSVERLLRATASQDGSSVEVWQWRDPGQAGKVDAHYTARAMQGITFRTEPATKSKLVYAGPLSAQAEAGNVVLLRGEWNSDFLAELEGFPDRPHDDLVDAASLAYRKLSGHAGALIDTPDPDRGWRGNQWAC